MDRAARPTSSFTVSVGGGGGRDRHGEVIAWLTVREGSGRVLGLAGSLAANCPDGITLGLAPRPTPSAHLTVARGHDRGLVDDLAAERWGRPEERWLVDRILLLRSHLAASGARYETLHEASLYAAS